MFLIASSLIEPLSSLLAQAHAVPLPGAGLMTVILVGCMGVFYRGGNKARQKRRH